MATAQIPAPVVAHCVAVIRPTDPPTLCGARGIFKVREFTPDGKTLEASACGALGHVELVKRALHVGVVPMPAKPKMAVAQIGR
jgi:hypothetical protein